MSLHQDFFFICFWVRRGIFLFDFRDGCLFDGIDHVEKVKVFLVIVAGFEDGRGHGAGAQPLLGGGGGWHGCNVVAILRIMLHPVAGGYIGGGGSGDSGGGGGSEVTDSVGTSVSAGVPTGSSVCMSLSMLHRPGRLS